MSRSSRRPPSMLARASQAAQDPADRFFAALDEGCRRTALARAADRLAQGLPTCGHVREDGLGICAAGPEELDHAPDNLHRHDFKPLLSIEARHAFSQATIDAARDWLNTGPRADEYGAADEARAAEMLAEACADIEQAEAGERARVERQERT